MKGSGVRVPASALRKGPASERVWSRRTEIESLTSVVGVNAGVNEDEASGLLDAYLDRADTAKRIAQVTATT
jgi:hypothetical protein